MCWHLALPQEEEEEDRGPRFTEVSFDVARRVRQECAFPGEPAVYLSGAALSAALAARSGGIIITFVGCDCVGVGVSDE